MRLISICPSNTELVGYLGLTSSLIGVDNYSDWPKEVQTLPKLGSDLEINIEKVKELQPDLVLASLSVPGMEKNIWKLEKNNIPYVIVPNPKTLSEVGDCLLFVGKVTSAMEKAQIVYEKYVSMIERYRALSKNVKKQKAIYWEWWAKPIFTPGRTNWLTEMSELAGGYNIFKDHQEASVQTNWEDVISRNPEVFCIAWVGVRKDRVNPKVILKRPNAREINAIQNNELYILEEELFCRPSPKLLAGLAKLASILHPGLYPAYHEKEDLLLGIEEVDF